MYGKSFEITGPNGEKITCNVLMTFEENNNNYMIYTDGELDENENIEVLATKYVEEGQDKIRFIPIETDAEWDLVDKKWSEANE